MATFKSTEIIICFDESGKQSKDPVQLMGAISIPSIVYNHQQFTSVHKLTDEYTFHWTDYAGYSKDRLGIVKLFDLAQPLAPYTQLNIINYSKSSLDEHAQHFKAAYRSKQKIVGDMIYTKLPERIFYGLLRGYGERNQIQAKILIEDATEYRAKGLATHVKDTLNIHSLYRRESFVITECEYRSKGEEIGVEMIDLLLSMVGLILENPVSPSNKKKFKIDLVLYLKSSTCAPHNLDTILTTKVNDLN